MLRTLGPQTWNLYYPLCAAWIPRAEVFGDLALGSLCPEPFFWMRVLEEGVDQENFFETASGSDYRDCRVLGEGCCWMQIFARSLLESTVEVEARYCFTLTSALR